MASSVRDLTEFLRDHESVWCDIVEGSNNTDSYEAAAKRILVHMYTLGHESVPQQVLSYDVPNRTLLR